MPLYLYRPVLLWRAGRCVCVTNTADILPREAALLVALKWATIVPPTKIAKSDFGSPARGELLSQHR